MPNSCLQRAGLCRCSCMMILKGAPKHATQLAPVADRLLDLLVGSVLFATEFPFGDVEVLNKLLSPVLQVFGQIVEESIPTMHVSVHGAHRVALVVPLNVDRVVLFVAKAWND